MLKISTVISLIVIVVCIGSSILIIHDLRKKANVLT